MRRLPDKNGHFEEFGGKYIPETLVPTIEHLERVYMTMKKDSIFQGKLRTLLHKYAGRPTPLFFSQQISKELEFNVFLKREDLTHTGAHKINNALGQILLAKHMNKTRIVAETGAGQHGVATATVSAQFGFDCSIYMGEKDMDRQRLNVFKMELLGAKVCPVSSGSRTLKDATNAAIRDWVANVDTTYYLIGSSVGPHPYPMIVRDFQTVIGKETKKQFAKENIIKNKMKIPDLIVACVGGGSNAIGIFYPFLNTGARLVGVEASGRGLESNMHAATLTKGTYGVLHGSASLVLQDNDGQIKLPHSISAGLDYPGVGPEHAYLKKIGRVEYTSASNKEALKAFQFLTEKEGIMPALESAHALAFLMKDNHGIPRDSNVVMCLSGRGDKDVHTVADSLGKKL